MSDVFKNSFLHFEKASKLIPGGAHTYSKGADQFPYMSPNFIKKGKGARVIDMDDNEFVDWGMALTSVILGYANEEVNEAISRELINGVSFMRPSFIEAEIAEQVVSQIDSVEMVKFAKNGSDATTGAIRLARAYTGKDIVLRCSDHPFFSVNDWFIGDTAINSGVPEVVQQLTKGFKYNDIEDFIRVVDENKKQGIACAILQPQVTELPKDEYLLKLLDVCEKNGIVLIFDEVVTGFRYHPKGAQHVFNVKPHLTTFGKSMGNGFSISALGGKRDIMRLGGLDHEKERVFLLSTTYGAETHHLRACEKVIEILNRNDYAVTKHIWSVGERIVSAYNKISQRLGLEDITCMSGVGCKPFFIFKDKQGSPDNVLRTYFVQEMIKKGVLVQGLIPSMSHGENEILQTIDAFEYALGNIQKVLNVGNLSESLIGPPIKAVFRKYN